MKLGSTDFKTFFFQLIKRNPLEKTLNSHHQLNETRKVVELRYVLRPSSRSRERPSYRNSLCGSDGSGFSSETRSLLGPLALVLGTDLFLAQLVIPLGESEILEELPVHAILAGMTMGLGLLDTVAMVLPVLIVMRNSLTWPFSI